MIEIRQDLLPEFVNKYCYGDLSKVIITKQLIPASPARVKLGRDHLDANRSYCYVGTLADVMNWDALRVGDLVNVANTQHSSSGNYSVYNENDVLQTVACYEMNVITLAAFKYQWDNGQLAYLATKPVYRAEYHGSLFRDILLVRQTTTLNIGKSLLNGDFTNDSDNYIGFDGDVASTEMVVYVMRGSQSQTIETTCFLQGTDIVSIDYIGNFFTTLDFSNLPFINLKEINLSNCYKTLGDIYNGIKISDSANVLYGNNRVIEITASTFAGSNLKKMVFPDTNDLGEIYSIPAGAFAGCTQLEEVYIPDGSVTGIGANAFKGCNNLKYVYIGSDVSTIGSDAFGGCYNIEKFDVSPLNSNFAGGNGALFKKYTTSVNPLPFEQNYAWTMLFGNRNWFNGGYETSYVPSASLVNYFKSSSNCTPSVGMYVIDSNHPGTDKVTDIYGNVYTTALLVTSSNLSTVRGWYQGQHYFLDDKFLVNIAFLVGDIAANACAGDTAITSVNLTNTSHPYYFIQKIDNQAFKGCTGITALNLPDYMSGTSYQEGFSVGNSVFEGCSGLTSLTCKTTRIYFGDKAFFGCTGLQSINYTDQIPGEIGTLCFGNTPNLASITSVDSFSSTAPYNIEYNTILKKKPNQNEHYVYVGCKNSSLYNLYANRNITEIGDYAFYGCTNLTLGDGLDSGRLTGYTTVGNSAFYGCSLLGSTMPDGTFGLWELVNIGEKAFYGCTSLGHLILTNTQTIGSKAFGNSGVFRVELLQRNVASIEDDAFDGCNLQLILVSTQGLSEDSTKPLRNSAIDVENAFLKRLDTSGSTSLIKSGDGKDIVNTVYSNPNKNITVIKPEAFSGVNLNTESNTSNTIYIPSSVITAGSNMLAKSKVNNSTTGTPSNPFKLKLCGMVQGNANMLVNTGVSTGLLYYVGAKYFKKIVADTTGRTNKTYRIVVASGTPPLLIVEENINNGQSTQPIAQITYSNSGDLIVSLLARLLPSYKDNIASSSAVPLDTPIDITLMRNGQMFTQVEIQTHCDSDLTPGTTWLGNTIPNDVTYTTGNVYTNYSASTVNAFANCDWVTEVISERNLISTTGAFKGCTNLEWYSVDGYYGNTTNYSTFYGTLPASTFEGCTDFRGMRSTSNKFLPYILKYQTNSMKGCTTFNRLDDLRNATHIEAGAFDGSGLTGIDLCSAISIDPTAFSNCNLEFAQANSISGYYGTTTDNANIVEFSSKLIAVGSTHCTSFDNYRGVGPYAFYGRPFAGNVDITVPGYIIAESAFSKSNVNRVSAQSNGSLNISQNAFKDCLYLTSVVLTSGSTLAASAFEGCSSLTTLTIPASISIPKKAFAKCTGLTTITTSSSIGESAFEGCTSITSINASGLIGVDAFNGCTSLRTITLGADCRFDPTSFIKCPISTINSNSQYYESTGYILCEYDSETQQNKVVLGDKTFDLVTHVSEPIQIIGQHAFDGRGLIGSITIPHTVTRIEDYAFANNPSLTYVSIPSTVEFIGDNAFAGCGLVSFTIPDSCTYIGAGVLKGCPLTNGFNCNTFDKRYSDDSYITDPTTLHGPVQYDNDGFFKSTLDLTYAYFSEIRNEAFKNTDINVVRLPMVCTDVQANSFEGCHYLAELHISSESGITFYRQAFYGCANLHDIYLHTMVIPETEGNNEFYGCGSSCIHKFLHVPGDLVDDQDFIASDFYSQLSDAGYDVVGDM